jgi:hypothetical protein
VINRKRVIHHIYIYSILKSSDHEKEFFICQTNIFQNRSHNRSLKDFVKVIGENHIIQNISDETTLIELLSHIKHTTKCLIIKLRNVKCRKKGNDEVVFHFLQSCLCPTNSGNECGCFSLDLKM